MNPFALVHLQPDQLRERVRHATRNCSGGTRGERRWASAACLVTVALASAGALLAALH